MAWSFLGSKNNLTCSANTDIFGAGNTLAPIQPPAKIVIFANFSSTGILTLRRTLQGGTTISEVLNNGNPLTANFQMGFDNIIDSGETIDFRYSTACTINKLTISEVTGETD